MNLYDCFFSTIIRINSTTAGPQREDCSTFFFNDRVMNIVILFFFLRDKTDWDTETPEQSLSAPWAGDSPLTVRCTQLPLWKVSDCCSSIRTRHSYQPWSSERTGSIWREAFPCREALPGDAPDKKKKRMRDRKKRKKKKTAAQLCWSSKRSVNTRGIKAIRFNLFFRSANHQMGSLSADREMNQR